MQHTHDQSQRLAAVQPPVIPIVARWTAETPGTISLGQGIVSYGPPPDVMETVRPFGGAAADHRYYLVRVHSALDSMTRRQARRRLERFAAAGGAPRWCRSAARRRKSHRGRAPRSHADGAAVLLHDRFRDREPKVWTWTDEVTVEGRKMKIVATITEKTPTSYTFTLEAGADGGSMAVVEQGKATKGESN